MYKDPYQNYKGHVTCVIYDRYSSRKQLPRSSVRQVNLATTFAESRNWTPAAIFSDKETSGKLRSRRGLDELFKFCEEHPGTAIIVEDLSRFARSDLAFANAILKMLEAGAFMYDTHEGYLTPKRLFQEAASAIDSIEQFQSRCQEGHDIAGLSGKYMKQVPFGYRKGADGTLLVDPVNSRIVIEIFQRIAAKEEIGKICKDLAARRILSPRGKKNWSTATIRRICSNPIYTGQLSHRRKTYAWDRKVQP